MSLRLYGRILLEHTHWQIWPGQHWAVIGPNGSGKSTLMKALCGQVPIVKGKITYHLESSYGPNRIAHVSFDAQATAAQHASPFFQARWNTGVAEKAPSVYEYLIQSRKINPFQIATVDSDQAEEAKQRARAVERLGIKNLCDKSVTQLSNGEMRKVLIAQALVRNPRILILDNPFTGLDQQFRNRFKTVIKELMQSEMCVIVVTTRWDEILPDTTHVLVVDNGRVIKQGTRKNVLGEYAHHSLPRREEPAAIPPQFSATRSQDASAPGPNNQVRRITNQRSNSAQKADSILVFMQDINISYDATKVLTHVNWTIHKGENWALLGPNGSGKTTLLSLIVGDNPQAYANDITLFGKHKGSGESIWETKKHIGWIAPELHLHYPKAKRCLDVVCSGFFDSIGLWQKCSSKQRTTAEFWMQKLDIAQHANLAFGMLSQGEQRMVLMARALVKYPSLLILDEPCQGLDEKNRDRVLQTIDAISAHLDATIIYVTHNPNELPRAITHVLRLSQGNVLDAGPI
ncbi:MAG: ATP-binding cassette domain-containing protein [Anaerolineae bacterium]|nr:ATP-binding cassette domain-containing protein [Anaerolineae bacterium]